MGLTPRSSSTDGVIQAINKPARDYLALDSDPRGASLDEVLLRHGLEDIGSTLEKLDGDEEEKQSSQNDPLVSEEPHHALPVPEEQLVPPCHVNVAPPYVKESPQSTD